MDKDICIIKKYKFFYKEFETIEEAANFFSVSKQFMYAVFSGIKKPSNRILDLVGMKRIKFDAIIKLTPNTTLTSPTGEKLKLSEEL